MDYSVTPPRVGALVQARLGSTRLPGKALLPLPLHTSTSVLAQVLRRASRASGLHTVIVATTDQPTDDALAAAAEALGYPVFRGDEQDVLRRFTEAAAAHQLDVVVRLTADNPAIDPHYIGAAVRAHQAAGADYTLTTGLPLGTNLEVIGRAALDAAHAQAAQPDEREHVTPYLRRHPELFRLQELPLPVPPALAACRLTLDYPSDYALQHLLYTQLPPDFGLTDVARLLAEHPWLRHINDQNEQIRV